MDAIRQAYDEVYAYTMGRPGFILQHVVDVFAVQSARSESATMGTAFGLAGLYLHVERKVSGRDVQKIHMRMGQQKRAWPAFSLQEDRGSITAVDVLAAPEGPERDRAIEAWCESVWTACHACRPAVVELLREFQIE